jgi:hypothetical protein
MVKTSINGPREVLYISSSCTYKCVQRNLEFISLPAKISGGTQCWGRIASEQDDGRAAAPLIRTSALLRGCQVTQPTCPRGTDQWRRTTQARIEYYSRRSRPDMAGQHIGAPCPVLLCSLPCFGFTRRPFQAWFFYKYDRLHSLIVRNNPLSYVLSKLAWRDEKKVTRMSSRQCIWRSWLLAIWNGGKYFPPLPLAEGHVLHRPLVIRLPFTVLALCTKTKHSTSRKKWATATMRCLLWC